MNIFVTDVCPSRSAEYLDNKRVIKMCLESAQMLCTAIWELQPHRMIRVHLGTKIRRKKDGSGFSAAGPRWSYHFTGGKPAYAPTHANHPCNVWVRKSWRNYFWLYRHWIALMDTYGERYGRTHASAKLIVDLTPPLGLYDMPKSFVNCAAHKGLGINYKNLDDVFTAYKLYLNDRWDTDKRAPEWGDVI